MATHMLTRDILRPTIALPKCIHMRSQNINHHPRILNTHADALRIIDLVHLVEHQGDRLPLSYPTLMIQRVL